MHKFLRVITISALIAVFAVNSALANPFHDVPEDHWAYDSISYLADKGILEGYPDGTFGGSRSFTRYEMAMVFSRILATLEAEIQDLVEKEVSAQTGDMAAEISKAMDTASKALADAFMAQLSSDRALSVASQANKTANAALKTLDAIEGLDIDISEDEIEVVRQLAQRILNAAAGFEGIEGAEDIERSIVEANEIAIFAVELAQKAQNAASSAAQLADDSAGKAYTAMKAAAEAMDAAQSIQDSLDQLKRLDEDEVIFVTGPGEVAVVLSAEKLLQLVLDVNDKADDLAKAVALLSKNSVDEIEAIQIARNVVAREISNMRGNLNTSLQAVNGDITAVNALITTEAARLEKEIKDLAKEFEYELFLLGLRVDRITVLLDSLDKRIDDIESDVEDIRAEMARVRVSGTNTSTVKYGTVEGTGTPKVDPRNNNSSNLYVAPPSFVDLLQLRLEAELVEGVDVKVGVDATLDHAFANMGVPDYVDPLLQNLKAFAEVATDGVISLARLGALDAANVAGMFNKFTLNAKEFGDNQAGAFVKVSSGAGVYSAFVSTLQGDDRYTLGFAGKFKPNSATNFTANLVRVLENMLDPSETKRTVVSVVGGTKADNVALDLLYARDVEEKASVAQVNGTLDVAGVSFKAEYALMDAIWGTNNRTPYAEKQKLAEEKSHSKPIQANQNRLLGRVEAPLFGFKVYGQASKYVTSISDGEFDRSLEVGVSDLNIGGFLKVNALKENGLNQFSQVRDRIFGQAVLDLGVDLSISYHKQISDQLAATEHTQNHYMLKVADSIELSGVPINYALAFGSSISNSKSHTKFELGVNSFKLTPVVEVSAKYALTNNVLTKNEWLPNANWTDEDLVERSLGANWALNQKMTVTGNLAMADSNVNGLKVTRDAGFNYKLEAFGGDLTLGYGYRLVTVDGIVDGTARNTVSASFAKSVNGFVLKANGRYVSGGTAAEAGNDNDTTGSIELTYPVLDNAVFTLQGNYVKSEGDKLGRPEYNGHSLTAGLKVTF